MPVAPGIGLPEASSTVTVIVSSPRANPVVSRSPRSTVLKVVSTFRVVVTGCDVNSTCRWSRSPCTRPRLLLLVDGVQDPGRDVDLPPGLVKAGLGVTAVTWTKRSAP